MTFRISTTARNAQSDGIMQELGAGTIKCYTGTQPASTADSPTGTLLATLPLQNPVATAAVNGVATATLPVNTSNTLAGDLGWGRVARSDGTAIIDGTISLAAGGGDIIVNVITLAANDVLQLVSFTITAPAL